MKNIIQRHLPLNIKYFVTYKKYIPLSEGYGQCCDNCGQLIANIATVKNEDGKVFNIGFDCLETILINNHLLSAGDVEQYERTKKMIPKIIRFSKVIKEAKGVTGLLFEVQKYKSEYFTFYWLFNGQTNSRQNDYVKLKDMNFNFLLTTLKYIFPNIQILTKLE